MRHVSADAGRQQQQQPAGVWGPCMAAAPAVVATSMLGGAPTRGVWTVPPPQPPQQQQAHAQQEAVYHYGNGHAGGSYGAQHLPYIQQQQQSYVQMQMQQQLCGGAYGTWGVGQCAAYLGSGHPPAQALGAANPAAAAAQQNRYNYPDDSAYGFGHAAAQGTAPGTLVAAAAWAASCGAAGTSGCTTHMAGSGFYGAEGATTAAVPYAHAGSSGCELTQGSRAASASSWDCAGSMARPAAGAEEPMAGGQTAILKLQQQQAQAAGECGGCGGERRAQQDEGEQAGQQQERAAADSAGCSHNHNNGRNHGYSHRHKHSYGHGASWRMHAPYQYNGSGGGGGSHRRHEGTGRCGGGGSHREVVERLRSTFADPSSTTPYDVPPVEPGAEAAADDPRAILLFDLNGTLTCHTSIRRASGVTRLRPGTEHLMRLRERFRLGIYTSSTVRTVQTAMELLERAAGGALFERGLVLHREHSAPAPPGHVDAGGNAWDTVKPLGRYFSRLDRVVLVDDDSYKAIAGEEANMLLVPCWREDDADCPVLRLMCDLLLAEERAEGGEAKAEGEVAKAVGDVRRWTAAVSSQLQQAAAAAAAAAEERNRGADATPVTPHIAATTTPTSPAPLLDGAGGGGGGAVSCDDGDGGGAKLKTGRKDERGDGEEARPGKVRRAAERPAEAADPAEICLD